MSTVKPVGIGHARPPGAPGRERAPGVGASRTTPVLGPHVLGPHVVGRGVARAARPVARGQKAGDQVSAARRPGPAGQPVDRSPGPARPGPRPAGRGPDRHRGEVRHHPDGAARSALGQPSGGQAERRHGQARHRQERQREERQRQERRPGQAADRGQGQHPAGAGAAALAAGRVPDQPGVRPARAVDGDAAAASAVVPRRRVQRPARRPDPLGPQAVIGTAGTRSRGSVRSPATASACATPILEPDGRVGRAAASRSGRRSAEEGPGSAGQGGR